ncbi:putative ABC transporter [Hortaea werneckii]|nr:putative ABC transporter [Hortaea werneckii]
MSKGELVVHGTAPELKERHGGGYRVVTSDSKAETIAEERHSYEENGDIVLAAHDSNDACRMAKKLQSAGIDDLYIRGPTIEDVFIGVARELAEEMHELQSESTSANGNPPTSANGQIEKTSSDNDTDKQSLDLVAGKGTSFPQQVWILWRKRLLIFTRNWLPFLCAIIIPIITAGLTTMFLGGFDRLECSRSAQFNSPQVVTLGALEVYWGILVPTGPAQQFDPSQLPATYQQFSDRIQLQSSFSGYQDYIANNFRDVVPGGFYLDVDIPEAAGQAPLMSYRLNDGLGYAAIAKTLIDQYLTGTTINAEFSTFALPFVGSTGDSLQLVLYITLATCAYSGFFALYPTFERLANIRNLHYSNGIRPAPLWLAYWLFDGGFAVVVAVVSVAMFGSLSDVWYAPSYLCVVFFLFGLSSIFLAYLVSLFCRSQLAAFAFVAGGQAICALIYFLLYLVILTFAAAESLQQNLNVLQFTFGLITPSGNILRSLLIALNESQIVCRDQGYFSYPGDIEAYGCPILYLVLQTLVFYGSLVWHDGGWSILTILNRRKRGKDTDDDEKDISTLPPDVQAEMFRAEQSKDQLKTLHLDKEFGHDRVVDDVTFGVDGSEVLALLGPNGAGKTTTLSMIRGDLHPSSRRSDVLICNTSALNNRLATRQMLGVCPQFNTMDYMTVTEHLSFYARVRGVPDVSSNVLKVIDAVGLSSYRHRMAGKLSGGNQRKLSLATSIIGNPAVLLLDEPSTGMDAVAMRVMWKAIRAIAAGRAIVLTTHSMEEASALSSRTAILDRRLLALQGTRELVTKYSQGLLHVHVVLESGAKASAAEMQMVREWITTRFPGAEADDESGSGRRGQLRFRIPPDAFEMHGKPHAELSSSGGSRMVKLIDMLERSKREIGISAYSVSHATLEDVFLDIVSRNREW